MGSLFRAQIPAVVFSFYCDEWLRLRKPKVKESTYIKYDTALIKHIKPKLGGCFPMGITTGLIDGFTEERGTGS